jgi:hypothetical protein
MSEDLYKFVYNTFDGKIIKKNIMIVMTVMTVMTMAHSSAGRPPYGAAPAEWHP